MRDRICTITASLFALCTSLATSGCLPIIAATTPYQRDSINASPGTDRATVIAKYGEPDSKSQLDGQEVDVYENGDGPKPGQRGRAVASAIAFDVLTLGILEIGFIPEMCGALEGHASYTVYTITYASDGKVLSETNETKKSHIEPSRSANC
ncbi:MAG TPA: hypothetical protein VMT61_04810 [Candidatus Binataceae bacterium]|nr:hypothetical protein [Candidatus Binataceae bacterium]